MTYGAWQYADDIHVLGLKVCVDTPQRIIYATNASKSHYVVYCDNVVAVAVMRRLRGMCHATNEIILPLANLLLESGCTMEVHWVATDLMLADRYTRLQYKGKVGHFNGGLRVVRHGYDATRV